MYAKSFLALDSNGRLTGARTVQAAPYAHYTCHLCGSALRYHPQYDTELPWFEHTDDRLTEHGQQCPYVRPERREIQLIKRLQRRIQYSPDNSGGNMRILNCYMANDSKGHFVTAKEAAKHNRQDVLCCVSCGCPLTLQRGNDGQPPWFEHDQMTVAEKILLRCTWLDPAEKEARRLHLQGMTVPDYTVKVRKWFCVMCDEDYEGEKCCPRCGTGVYSREGGCRKATGRIGTERFSRGNQL
ncbi:hypothetical protein DTL22_26795 [Escherichia coli]|nr:hypothetical protein DTL22_26795 [Escherichia coli]